VCSRGFSFFSLAYLLLFTFSGVLGDGLARAEERRTCPLLPFSQSAFLIQEIGMASLMATFLLLAFPPTVLRSHARVAA